MILVFLLVFTLESTAQNKYITLQRDSLAIANNDISIITFHYNIASELINLSQYDEAKKEIEIIEELSIKAKYFKGLFLAKLNKADIYIFSSEKDKALDILEQLESSIDTIKPYSPDYYNLVRPLYSALGSLHKNLTNYSKSLEYYAKALVIAQKEKNKTSPAIILGNIATVYEKIGDLDKAIEYQLEALELKKKISTNFNIGLSYFNLAIYYQKAKYFNKSIELYEDSKEYAIKANDSIGIGLCNVHIGSVYSDLYEQKLNTASTLLLKETLDKADSLTRKGIEIFKILKQDYYLPDAYNTYGYILLKKGAFKEANENFYKAEKLARNNELSTLIESTKGIYISHKQRKEFEKALIWNEHYMTLLDSSYKLSNIKEVGEKQAEIAFIKQQAIKDAEQEKMQAIKDAEHEKLIAIEKAKKEKQKTITYAIGFGLVLVISFLAFVFNRLRITKKQKIVIEQQKATVEKAHSETELQKQAVEKQKEIIEETHKEITDSINYAKRLQNAILPSLNEVNQHLKNNFILFLPKDVVSGDFYWFAHKGNTSYIAAADCTGHGVPGALVSVVCSNALNRTVNEFKIYQPAKILDKTRELVIETFAKSGENIKDGMDISLCAISDKKITFSGANNPLWLIRKKELLTQEEIDNKIAISTNELALLEYKADKQPIGLYEKMNPFTEIEIDIHKGDVIYLFTDGFADQFGGERGKKYKYKPFKKLLMSASQKPLDMQLKIIKTEFETWKTNIEQVDDICIIGYRI